MNEDIRIVAFVGPAGAGKSALAWRILDNFSDTEIVLSYTTRELRETDRPREYQRLHTTVFDLLVEKGWFFAWNVGVHEKQYGTSRASLNKVMMGEKRQIIIVTPEAAEILYKMFPKSSMFFFVCPPERRELERRLIARGETEQSADRRIKDCRHWLAESLDSPIPYVYIKNDGPIEKTFATVESYFI